MFFCRHPGLLRRLFDVETDYLPSDTHGANHLYQTSLQWSRRFIGLKVFLTLAVAGLDGIRDPIRRQLATAAHLRARLQRVGWVLANHSALPVVCFAHPGLATGAAVREAAARIEARGRAWVSPARLPEGPVLRACITHDDSSPDDVDLLVEELERVRRHP